VPRSGPGHPDVIAWAKQTIGTATWVGVPLLSAIAFAHRSWLTIEPRRAGLRAAGVDFRAV
jgi:hypothetical protein